MRNFKLISAACAVVASALILPTGASANTIVQSLSVDINPAIELTGGEVIVSGSSYNQFDPTLGTLSSISISLVGPVLWTGTTLFTSPLNAVFKEDTLVWTTTAHLFPIDCIGYGECHALVGFNDATAVDLSFNTGPDSRVFGLVFSGGALGDHVTTDDSPLTGSITYNYTPTAAVPEPTSLSLLLAGLVGVAAMRRRRTKAA